MFKRPFLVSYLILSGFAFWYREPLQTLVFYNLTRNMAQKAVFAKCKDDLECRSAMRPELGYCAMQSIGPENPMLKPVNQKRLVACLQKKFLAYSCKKEKRCVATIETYFDKCFSDAFPAGSDLQDAKRGEEMVSCLQGFSLLIDAKKNE